jgi:hypothetical protein
MPYWRMPTQTEKPRKGGFDDPPPARAITRRNLLKIKNPLYDKGHLYILTLSRH